MEHLHIPDYQAEIDASYAHGSIGRAKQVATSQEFADMTQNALRILKNADGMEVYLLEYTTNPKLIRKIKEYCKEQDFHFYISSSLELR